MFMMMEEDIDIRKLVRSRCMPSSPKNDHTTKRISSFRFNCFRTALVVSSKVTVAFSVVLYAVVVAKLLSSVILEEELLLICACSISMNKKCWKNEKKVYVEH